VAFSRTAAEELSALQGEPQWLRARRLEAFDLYERLPFPDTKRDADWRQVDLKELDLARFQPFEPPDGAVATEAIPDVLAVMGQRGATVASARQVDPSLAKQGVIFAPLAVAARDYPELVGRYLFRSVRPDRDKFTALHAALLSGGSFLYVPEGVALRAPIVSQFWTGSSAAAVFPHTLIVVGPGAQVRYVDEYRAGDSAVGALTSGSVELFAEEGANVSYVSLQRWHERTWQFATQRFHLGRDAHLDGVHVALGARFARLRMEALLEGQGSSAQLRGVFFATGDQAYDFRTLQDHFAPNTTSDLLYKGALRDFGRSVYVGLVRVEKNARGTSANQANRNLLLSERAKATSEPILEIENNDILRCSHGATVGPVDPEHMFYLQSRGIPNAVAERMLVQGFLVEVLDRIPIAYVREAVEAELTQRIG
jgi:Fe-S cluster assembly protein SufD